MLYTVVSRGFGSLPAKQPRLSIIACAWYEVFFRRVRKIMVKLYLIDLLWLGTHTRCRGLFLKCCLVLQLKCVLYFYSICAFWQACHGILETFFLNVFRRVAWFYCIVFWCQNLCFNTNKIEDFIFMKRALERC